MYFCFRPNFNKTIWVDSLIQFTQQTLNNQKIFLFSDIREGNKLKCIFPNITLKKGQW